MIQEEYISFEQAKALKELGFPQDNPLNMYNRNSKIGTYWGGNEEFIKNNLFACPTQSLVQKWLREEKKQALSIVPVYQKNIEDTTRRFIGFGYFIQSLYPISNEIYDFVNDDFKTYEQALSAGIDKCIELLKKES